MIETVALNGLEMEYFRFGTGEKTFVILPGVSVKSVMRSAAAIRKAYSVFEREYTVYVFDRRKNMPTDYTVAQMARDTAAVMTRLQLTQADVFGASQGGMIAMCLAIAYPRLVRRLALGSTAARADEAIAAGVDRWISSAQKKDMTALTADFVDDLYSKNTIGRFKDLLLHMNDDATDTDIERFIIQAQAINGFDVFSELDGITCPTLVIGSQGDKLLPPACSREIAEKLGCELYLYGEEYGHCVFDEAPDYKQRLLDFFSRDA